MKTKIGPIPYIYPIPVVLVGAEIDGSPNFELIGQTGIMGIKPPIVYISSGVDHYTNQGILDNGVFSINIPHTAMLAETDYCGVVSGRTVDKGGLFNIYYGELEKAPMIAECKVNLECKVIQNFSIDQRQIFVAKVVQTFVDEDLALPKGDHFELSDLGHFDPIMYALDNRYYKIGKPIGWGYQESKKLNRK